MNTIYCLIIFLQTLRDHFTKIHQYYNNSENVCSYNLEIIIIKFIQKKFMLTILVVFYTIVGIMGIYLFTRLFSLEKTNMLVGIIHGSLGLLGIGILIFYISFVEGESPFMSILLFFIAMCIGGGMLAAKLTGKKFPMWLALIHAIVAISGIYLLYEFWVRVM